MSMFHPYTKSSLVIDLLAAILTGGCWLIWIPFRTYRLAKK